MLVSSPGSCMFLSVLVMRVMKLRPRLSSLRRQQKGSASLSIQQSAADMLIITQA